MDNNFNRRSFLQTSLLAGAGVAIPSAASATSTIKKTTSKSKINIGVIGSGLRGQSHIALAHRREDCEVVAICDVDDEMINRTKKIFEDNGKPMPKIFKGERAYLDLLKDETIDAVLIASPWRFHSEQAIAAMNAGKYVGVEVCGAFSIDECWELVNTQERTGSHLFFLENVCYRRDVMAVLNMARQQLFGEMIHLEGGYQHDLRAVKFNNGKQPYGGGVEFGEKAFSEAKWRTQHSVHRNGDLYPTHGVGPVAQFININRGNRFTQLTSTASKARGLHNYIVEHPDGGENHPNARVEFRLGDKVTTVLQTNNGETVVLHHDTNLPRPYSLGFRVQGTKGLWMDINQSIHVEGKSKAHEWDPQEKFMKEYDHPLWKKYESDSEGAGHGGMDFFVLHAFIEALKKSEPMPLDVYDMACWSVVTPLSEQSIAQGGGAVLFPDFTSGKWISRKPIFGLDDRY